MGTRNLTMVIHNAETKVAQYGQWDGCPEGQGKTALEFLKSVNMEAFKAKLKAVKWVDEEKQKEIDAYLLSIGVTDGWMTMAQASQYKERYPLFSRDNGAKVLEKIMASSDTQILLYDQSSFAGNSLMCEWAYVIDLDKNTFEVYQGFNKAPLTPNDRFHRLAPDGEYHPVKIVKSFDLSSLPESDEFVEQCESAVEQE